MTTIENTLKPTEEQLHAPTKALAECHQLRLQIKLICRQQQHFRLAIEIPLARIHSDNPQLLLENPTAADSPEPHHLITPHPRCVSLDANGTPLGYLPDSVTADAANERTARSPLIDVATFWGLVTPAGAEVLADW